GPTSHTILPTHFPAVPSLRQLWADPHVRSELRRAWQDSRANAPFTILKREEGGYIYYNQHTGHVEMDRAPSGTYNSIHKHPPQLDGGRRILLADYHVHPNQR
ncbi:MAG: hypothetical protein KDA47_03565, partial [Planctomycetales bacterium]|nr:hypothetical protein [Planctomycetales bacterium]